MRQSEIQQKWMGKIIEVQLQPLEQYNAELARTERSEQRCFSSLQSKNSSISQLLEQPPGTLQHFNHLIKSAVSMSFLVHRVRNPVHHAAKHVEVVALLLALIALIRCLRT